MMGVMIVKRACASMVIALIGCARAPAGPAPASPAAAAPGAPGCAMPLLVVEEDGRISAGSKQRLRGAVQAGLPLRVSWSFDDDHDGKPELAHWADALFLSEHEGEVFTQIAEIRRQAPRTGERQIVLSSTPERWTGSLGSTGVLEGTFNRDQAPLHIQVRVVWCVDPRVPRENLPAGLLSAELDPAAR